MVVPCHGPQREQEEFEERFGVEGKDGKELA